MVIGAIIALLNKRNRDKIMNLWQSKAGSKVGRLSLILFGLAFIAFYMNSITVLHYIINIDELVTTDQRPWILCFGKIPYQIGRFIMEIFFILR